jgi:hypothetical protein
MSTSLETNEQLIIENPTVSEESHKSSNEKNSDPTSKNNPATNRANGKPNTPNLDPNKITRDELRTILKAMDQDGFDKIMEDYVKEISDPNNISETNQYLRECMERKDLPANVKLIQPTEGFVFKSTKFNVKKPGLRQKVFINLVGLKEISPPQIDHKTGMCSLPHLLNKQRNDQDKKGNICYVFDIAFNPEALKKAEENLAFKKFMCDTAINGINNNILKGNNEKISNDFVLKTKIKYKGKEISLMNINVLAQKEEFKNQLVPNEDYKTEIQKEIDQLKAKETQTNQEDEDEDKVFDKPDIDYEQSQRQIAESGLVVEEEKNVKPKYKIKYSDDVQLHKYFYNPNNFVGDAQYSKLIIDLIVPRIENINYAEVELDENKLHFKYKDVYLLDIDLPVKVDKNTSEAKFDRKRNLLSISALIIRKNKQELKLKEDENIEIVNSDEEREREKEEKIKKIEESKKANLDNDTNKEKINKSKEDIELKEKSKEIKNENTEIKNELEKDSKNNEFNKEKIEGENRTLEKLEFNEKVKNPIELEIKNEEKDNKENINVKELIKEVPANKFDDDDIEDGFPINDNSNKDISGDKRQENNNGDQKPKKTFEKKEMAQLAFLNFNCPWIFELD